MEKTQPKPEIAPTERRPRNLVHCEFRRRNDKNPHVVLRQSLWRFIAGLIIHIPAISMSSIVIFLVLRPHCWFEEEWQSSWTFLGDKANLSPSSISKLFQFVAKIHEILVVLSLSAMVLNVTKKRLVDNSDGVPLGILTAPYRIGDIKFLFSGGFWNAHFADKTWQLSIFFALCTLLSLLIGPASAIGYVPTQNWWQIPQPFANWLMPVYLIPTNPSASEALWPAHLSEKSVGEGCRAADAYDTYYCPSAGIKELTAQIKIWSSSGADANTTLVERLGGGRRQLVSEAFDCASGGCAIATTLSHSTLMTFGIFSSYMKRNNGGKASQVTRPRLRSSKDSILMQPLVQTQCTAVDYRDAQVGERGCNQPTFESFFVNFFDDKLGSAYSPNVEVPSYLWNFTRRLNESTFEWINTSNLSFAQDRRPSIATVATVPYVVDKTNADGSKTTLQSSFLVSCAVEARWLYSQTIFDPKFSDLISTNVSVPSSYHLTPGARSFIGEAGPSINISSEWMKYLDLRSPTSNTSVMTDMLQLFLGPSPTTENGANFTGWLLQNTTDLGVIKNLVSGNISTVVSMLLADGIARAGYMDFVPVLALRPRDTNASQIDTGVLVPQYGPSKLASSYINKSDINRFYAFQFSVEQFGWGFGTPGAPTRFALVMMFIYISITIGYFSYDLIDRIWWRPYSVDSWDTLQEFMLLALKSKPSQAKLDGSGAKIKWGPEYWTEKVKIKEDRDLSVELVMDDRKEMRSLSRFISYH